MALTLADLFIGVDVFNRTGRVNITGTELAALINAAAGVGQAGKGISILQAINGQSPSTGITTLIDWEAAGASTIDYDDLNFYTPSAPTRFTIPDVDPPILRVQSYCTGTWSGAGGGVNTIRRLFSELNNDNGNNQRMARQEQGPVPVSGTSQFVASNWVAVIPGDFFEFSIFQNGGAGVSFRQVSGGLLVVR